MATTKSSPFGPYELPGSIFGNYASFFEDTTPTAKLRRQRKADCKPKKPKTVTDEQLLAIVDELEAKIKKQVEQIDRLEKYVKENYRLKMFAPAKQIGRGL